MTRSSAPCCPYPRDLARPTCYGCFRPIAYCVCNLVAPFDAHCNILILQHPHERKMYHSTARIVLRAITNSRLLSGIQFTKEALDKITQDQKTYLLYPSQQAADCETLKLDTSSTTIVLDGTWVEARKILHRNPFLKSLPALSFRQELRSNYRIRQQPMPHCLSTLESIAHLLKLNAAAQGHSDKIPLYNSLLTGFEEMVERQIQHWPRMLPG